MLAPLIACLALILLMATLVARIPLRWWWIRCFEFPRVQTAILSLACGIAGYFLMEPGTWRTTTDSACYH